MTWRSDGSPRALLFVGERRSPTAIAKGWRWEDGRLAARSLFAALRAMDVDPLAHDYVNIWPDPPRSPRVTEYRERQLRADVRDGALVVALGSRVSSVLDGLDIPHVTIVHPAARGKIRRRDRYATHVASVLGPAMRLP